MALAEISEDWTFRKLGVGWQFRPPEAPVIITFSSVSEKRGEFRAEVLVELAVGGHLLRRYINLLGSNSVRDLVRDLGTAPGGAGWPWDSIVAQGNESVIRAFRAGADLEVYEGELRRPSGIRWLCADLVMADVPNVWIASGSTGKSTFAVSLGVHHAFGAPFLGRQVTRGVPLLLDWESTADDFEEKIWLTMRGLGERAMPKFYRMRMRGPIGSQLRAVAQRIDQYGISLVIWDAVAAAGGPISEHAGYEAVAGEIEAVIGELPTTTHLMLDHVTGDELKTSSVPLKARGSTRKVEFARNQWTLVLDRDAHADHRHVVGWTHTKINRAAYLQPFGVELLHREDELTFKVLEASAVGPLQDRMAPWQKLVAILTKNGPLYPRDAALIMIGQDTPKAVHGVMAIFNKDGTVHMTLLPDGRLAARDPGGFVEVGRPDLRVVDDEVPF
jgi:hypothetical protein